MELERAENHQIGRLLAFPPLGVDIGHAGRLALGAVEVDLEYVGIRPQLEVRHLAQRWQDVHVRRRLGVHVAHVATAKTAEVARAHLRAVGVGVWPRGIG